MAEIKAITIFRKLDSVGYRSFEAATVAAKMAGKPHHRHPPRPQSDPHPPGFRPPPHPLRLRHQPRAPRLRHGHRRRQTPRGAGGSYVDFSERVLFLMEAAWKYASLMYNSPKIRHRHLVVALVKETSLRGYLYAVSREFEKIKPDALTDDFAKIVAKSPRKDLVSKEGDLGAGAAPGEAPAPSPPPRWASRKPSRNTPSISLKKPQGRDRQHRRPRRGNPPDRRCPHAPPPEQPHPHRRGRRRQNRRRRGLRPAHRRGDVPPALKDVTLRSLEMGVLQAGASMKGEFESRLKPSSTKSNPPQTHHPLHRRGPPDDGRRRRRRHRRRRPTPQARPRPRHPPHRRRHHLG